MWWYTFYTFQWDDWDVEVDEVDGNDGIFNLAIWQRISFSYYCESHMWGLTTGCMPPWAAGAVATSALCKFDSTANWSQTGLNSLFVYHRFSLPVAKDSQLAEIQSCWCGTGSKVPVFHKTPLLLVLFGAPDCWNSVEARRQLKCVVRRPDTRGMSDSQKNMPLVAAVLHVCALYKMQADVCSMI